MAQNSGRKRKLLIGVVVLAVAGLAVFAGRQFWTRTEQTAHKPARARTVSVEVARAEKKRVPFDIDAIGTVTPIASVALKSRVETTIVSVHFEDGARVNKGDLLFTLDARQIDAQIAQAEGTLAKDQSQLEAAQRDLKRYSELIGKGATTQVNVDNAKTQTDAMLATIQTDKSALENLKVQKSYTIITAPISGRISAASVKAGNFVRPADTAPLATINQMAPVYVAFAIPQRALSSLRGSMKSGQAKVAATIPGNSASEHGTVAMVDNTVDATTGMVTIRGIMDNTDEMLWPGTLVNVKLTIRTDDAVVVPAVAVQRSQTGDFVFVVQDGKAHVQPVKVNRTFENAAVIESGLTGTESVVTDGQLLLTEGVAVEPRPRKAAGA
ncbi:MAG: efflux RND transporter periplasmic adaptor subunit [Afipia sp.]